MQEVFNIIWDWFTLNWVDALTFLYSLITTIIVVVKLIKNKRWEELKELLKTEIIPLMEEVEQKIGYSGKEKKDWVVKKLSDKLHIDLFKYKKVLALIEEIIADICSTTKIDVNKIQIVEDKKGGADNGQEIY